MPNGRNIYKMAIKLSKAHFQFQGPPKSNQIGIFGISKPFLATPWNRFLLKKLPKLLLIPIPTSTGHIILKQYIFKPVYTKQCVVQHKIWPYDSIRKASNWVVQKIVFHIKAG
jgi:hypothetical protein